ncbi:hypothetical protein [Zavarzinella formosa]|uniref:hypothetical protein n=1 Tax=Zavarzinella formosa TaxID=360055 RepID=UPI0003176D00|nr:hypothetical protein [Zavarzinella formosa]
MTPVEIVLSSVVLGVGLGFAYVAVTVPIRARSKNWISAVTNFEPVEEDCLTADAIQIIADLHEDGFVVRGYWRHTGHAAATGQITLMEHPKTLDMAKILVATAGARRQVTLVFQTRFDDGTEIATANNQVTTGIPPPPGVTVLWLPEESDPRRLIHVHQQALDYLGSGKKRRPVGPDPVGHLIDGRERMLAHQVETGYFSFDATSNRYWPTWKGATLITWRQLWPIRPLHRAWRRRPTRKLLQELGVRLDRD